MTILADSATVVAVKELDLSKGYEHTLAHIYGSDSFELESIHIECLEIEEGTCSPTFSIEANGIILLGSWQCYLYRVGDQFSYPAVNYIPGGCQIQLKVCNQPYNSCKIRVSLIGRFQRESNMSYFGPVNISGGDSQTLELEKVNGHLMQLIEGQARLSKAIETVTEKMPVAEPGFLPKTTTNTQNPCSEVKMETLHDKDLDNSLWSELPEEIREAAEKAGIGLEDLHEMVKDYIALKQGGIQQERWLSFIAKDNLETRRPIILAKIEAEKELKLAKIQSDAEVAKAKAASEATIRSAELDQKSRKTVQISSAFRYLFVSAATGTALSYIAYCVAGIFI